MKSLASSLMLVKAALSNSQTPSFTLSNVSLGVLAWNGEMPLNLNMEPVQDLELQTKTIPFTCSKNISRKKAILTIRKQML